MRPQQANPRDLNTAAVRAMAAGDFAGARGLLEQALAADGGNIFLWLNFAGCCRGSSDFKGALDAVENALRIDPRSFMALLMKASLLESEGRIREAGALYGTAAGLAPSEDTLDPATRAALVHGREVHARHVEELRELIDSELGPIRARGSTVEAGRINAFVDLALNRRRNYRQEPTQLFYPGLPAVEFYERDEFPWLETFERATPAIREELMQVLRGDLRDFVPYITYPDSVPLDQWAGLNNSRRWSALHLYYYGEPVEANSSRCPATMQTLAALPQPRMLRRSPAAMFSALKPKTRIPPHTGVANTRLVVHLPLIVPEGCGFRVGNETREWREGEAWVFDDTIEHEAWNDSERDRFILICDIWNPRLSMNERELIAVVVAAMDKYKGVTPKPEL